jgi:hypothetical protein
MCLQIRAWCCADDVRHQNADGSPATDEQARTNVERFISAHIIPVCLSQVQFDILLMPYQDNIELPMTKAAPTLLDGLSIQVEQDGEGWKVTPGDIGVVGVKEVSWATSMESDAELT